MSVVKALQPLGERVEYIQSERAGKNALDFHIAFSMGRRLETHDCNGKAAKFLVVSKDGGFASLLSHIRSLGYPAFQGASIRDALGSQSTAQTTSSPTPNQHSVRDSASPPRSIQSAHAPTTVPDSPSLPVSGPNPKGISEPMQSLPSKATPTSNPATGSVAPRTQTSDANQPTTEAIDKVIAHLRVHPKNRPAKRATLEHAMFHLWSAEGRRLMAKAVTRRSLNAGVIQAVWQQATTRIPKLKK